MRYFKIFQSLLDSIFINEANVIYSNDFKKVLMKMDHPLAKEILSLEGQDKPVQNNYFDLKADTNDTISFITDRKQRELSAKVNWGKYQISKFDTLSPKEENRKYYDNLGMELPTEIKPIPEGEMGEVERMWTSPRSGKVWCKFVPDNREYDPVMINMVNLKKMWDDDVFFKQNRQDIRIGRGLRSLLTGLGIKFVDKDIEEFVNKWKATIDRLNDIFSNFEIVSGTMISHWYDHDNYFDKDRGTLGNSCMREVDGDFFDIYVYNKNVQMVIYKAVDDSDKIMGRAILWTLDDGKMFMDRIYTANDSDVELFRQFARDKGFYSKKYNGTSTSLESYSPSGDVVDLGSVDITLTKVNHDKYPYLDTFKYYSPNLGIITNDPKNRRGFLTLESTDGYADGDPDEEEENMIYVPFYGRDIPEGELVEVQWCETRRSSNDPPFASGYRLEDDCFFSSFYSRWISNSLSEKVGKKCDITGEWRLERDLVKIYQKGRGEDKWIISNYRGNSYHFSSYHGMSIPNDLAVEVFSVPDGSGWVDSLDWRIKGDGSYREVDGKNIDKAQLISKEISNESRRYISNFSEFKK